jgi:hypothetical protein
MMSLLAAVAVAASLAGQPPGLDSLAAIARDAFLRRDFGVLFDRSAPVRLTVPSLSIARIVRAPAATAILETLTRRAGNRRVIVIRAALVEGRHGYIELRQEFQLTGTQHLQRDRILLSTVLDENRQWRVGEVLIDEATGD